MCFSFKVNLLPLISLDRSTKSTLIKLIWTITILISFSSFSQGFGPEKVTNDFSVVEKVDTADLYDICYSKLKYNLRKCLYNNQAAFADCVYNSMEKWNRISDQEETNRKSSCCSFWDGNECLKNLVLDLCPEDESQFYFNDQELIKATMELQNGYCSSFQQLSDCYVTFWPSPSEPKFQVDPILVVSLSLIFSLTLIIIAFGFAVRYAMNRKKTDDDQMKISQLKQDMATSELP